MSPPSPLRRYNNILREQNAWDFTGTPYVPVYVKLPLGIINMECELVDPDGLRKQLETLKSVDVDGVMVDTWWGIVEANDPQQYNWKGYKQLFSIVRELGLRLQVVMSFHESRDDDVCIPLPKWIIEIGKENPDIYFTDRDGNRNIECLTWGIDEEPVLRGRTAVQVYFEYMQSFRDEFSELFNTRSISKIQIGLGACGELRYPSNPAKRGWKYPGIGEFQCYDKYLRKCLEEAAKAIGLPKWGNPPDGAGSYKSQPMETDFFCYHGEYRTPYGRFFLKWYSQYLIDHGDRVLAKAKLAFGDVPLSVKLLGMYWWYESASHAPELTAGYYNWANRDGYAPIVSMLKRHEATLNFTCAEHYIVWPTDIDPEGLFWQVLNAAWDANIPVASENALPCYELNGSNGYNKLLEHAKPRNFPVPRHISAFNYVGFNQALLEQVNFREFRRFIKRMHGEAVQYEDLLN
ncbi:putative beta-amylase [Helianthus annuus]|nr:putative beta-amylase [Helianthus annuus]KAJ0928701.1 putative beta-amylase [Helianthus annuus]KAJ0933063.1 putative beta-amylase [Helianthus annuus]